MVVMGPSVNEQQFNSAFDEIWTLLKIKYGIQNWPLPQYPDYSLDRIERKNNLKEAIWSCFELQSWEDF